MINIYINALNLAQIKTDFGIQYSFKVKKAFRTNMFNLQRHMISFMRIDRGINNNFSLLN